MSPAPLLFLDDARVTGPRGPGVTAWSRAGRLSCQSGELVACDPYMNGVPPFVDRIPTGLHEVQVVQLWLDSGQLRVAGALLALVPGALEQARRGALRWEPARHAATEEKRAFAYGVDYATGSFMDALAARRLTAEDPGREEHGPQLEMAGAGSQISLRGSSLNLVAFSSGIGDGFYSSYWGLDAAGRKLCLFTDFQLVTGPAPQEAPATPFAAVKARNPEGLRGLKPKKQDLGPDPLTQLTPLHWAAHAGEAALVEALLALKAPPGAKLAADERLWLRYPKGSTPLHLAVERGHGPVVEALLQAKASPDAASALGLTPLHWAVRAGHLALARRLLEAGAPADDTTTKQVFHDELRRSQEPGATALHFAVAQAEPAMVALLLEKGASPKAARRDGQTPLHLAARLQRLEVAQQLLAAGADPAARCKEGHTPLWHCLSEHQQGQHEPLALALLQAGGAVKDEAGLMHQAVMAGSLAVVQALLEKGLPLDLPDQWGRTPLALAAGWGHEALARLLLAKGARLAGADEPPLVAAARSGHEGMTRLLLAAGAPLEGTKKHDPVTVAQDNGHYGLAGILLEARLSRKKR